MAFDLVEWLDRVWVQVGVEQSEAEKRLYRDELYVLANDACFDLAREVADDPFLQHTLQTIWTIPVVAGLGAVQLNDDAPGKSPSTPNMLTDTIRMVYNIAAEVDGVRVRTRCYPLRSAAEYDRPQPLGYIWWVRRDTVLETIDQNGGTRYTDPANALDGDLEIHANFIPTVTNFPAHEELQPLLVKHMVKYARMKRDDRLAAALLKGA